MSFQRARTKAQINNRRDEILYACDYIYEIGGYDAVTIKAIAEQTSFSRPSIYTYFSTKEEIILGLLQKEYENWNEDLQNAFFTQTNKTKEHFCNLLTDSLMKHEKLMRLQNNALTIIENSASDKKLVEFKCTAFKTANTLKEAVLYFFPDADSQDVFSFINMFFAYIHGLYPLANPTKKQANAMKLAGYSGKPVFRDYCYKGILLLTGSL